MTFVRFDPKGHGQTKCDARPHLVHPCLFRSKQIQIATQCSSRTGRASVFRPPVTHFWLKFWWSLRRRERAMPALVLILARTSVTRPPHFSLSPKTFLPSRPPWPTRQTLLSPSRPPLPAAWPPASRKRRSPRRRSRRAKGPRIGEEAWPKG